MLNDSTGAAIDWRHYNAFGESIEESGDCPFDLEYQTDWQTVKIGKKWWIHGRCILICAVASFLVRAWAEQTVVKTEFNFELKKVPVPDAAKGEPLARIFDTFLYRTNKNDTDKLRQSTV